MQAIAFKAHNQRLPVRLSGSLLECGIGPGVSEEFWEDEDVGVGAEGDFAGVAVAEEHFGLAPKWLLMKTDENQRAVGSLGKWLILCIL